MSVLDQAGMEVVHLRPEQVMSGSGARRGHGRAPWIVDHGRGLVDRA